MKRKFLNKKNRIVLTNGIINSKPYNELRQIIVETINLKSVIDILNENKFGILMISDSSILNERNCSLSHIIPDRIFYFDIHYWSSIEFFLSYHFNMRIYNSISDIYKNLNINKNFFDVNCRIYNIKTLHKIKKKLIILLNNNIELGNLFPLYIDYLINKKLN